MRLVKSSLFLAKISVLKIVLKGFAKFRLGEFCVLDERLVCS
ncbi:hypothetical protein [Campylobacter geochelonis]|nr:hypothetical protein [Campylobacter geochelonis]